MRDLELTDGVITLTPFRLADAPTLMAIDLDPDAARWFDFPEITFDERAHRDHAEQVVRRWWAEAEAGNYYSFAIRRTEHALGAVGLRPIDDSSASLSYAVLAPERGHGYAARAVRLVAAAAFKHTRIKRLEIRADVDNVASQRVAERAGFVRDRVSSGTGTFRNYAAFIATPRDEVFYLLTAP